MAILAVIRQSDQQAKTLIIHTSSHDAVNLIKGELQDKYNGDIVEAIQNYAESPVDIQIVFYSHFITLPSTTFNLFIGTLFKDNAKIREAHYLAYSALRQHLATAG